MMELVKHTHTARNTPETGSMTLQQVLPWEGVCATNNKTNVCQNILTFHGHTSPSRRSIDKLKLSLKTNQQARNLHGKHLQKFFFHCKNRLNNRESGIKDVNLN